MDWKIKALIDVANQVDISYCKLNDRYHAVNIVLWDKDGAPFHEKNRVEKKCWNCNTDHLAAHLGSLLSNHGNEMLQYTFCEKQDGEMNKKENKPVGVMMGRKKNS